MLYSLLLYKKWGFNARGFCSRLFLFIKSTCVTFAMQVLLFGINF